MVWVCESDIFPSSIHPSVFHAISSKTTWWNITKLATWLPFMVRVCKSVSVHPSFMLLATIAWSMGIWDGTPLTVHSSLLCWPIMAPTKMIWAAASENVPSKVRLTKTQISSNICAVIKVFVLCMKNFCILCCQNCTQRIFWSDWKCAGWSESLLGAHVRRYVFWLCGSFFGLCIFVLISPWEQGPVVQN